jgi:hypothetical protein
LRGVVVLGLAALLTLTACGGGDSDDVSAGPKATPSGGEPVAVVTPTDD